MTPRPRPATGELFERRDRDSSEPPTVVEGVLERVTWSDPDSGWTVARLRPANAAPVVVVGRLPPVELGERLRVEGHVEDDPRWGRQLRVAHCRLLPPADPKGLERLLGSGLVHGVGPALAGRLVAKFGLGLLEILDREPERLAEVPGIGPSRVAAIRESWTQHRALRDLLELLQGFEVGLGLARRIVRRYGDRALEVVRRDPYRLALEVPGIGFRTADRLAREAGIPEDSPRRWEAALLHVLGERVGRGHAATERHRVDAMTRELLVSPDAPLDSSLGILAERGDVVVELDASGQELVFPRRMRDLEVGVAARIGELVGSSPRPEPIDGDRAVEWVQGRRGLELSGEQADAVRQAAASSLMILTGGPGTGKTTVVSALVEIFERKGLRVELAAPTGRAARRLAETTSRPARTLHRLLEWNGRGASGFARGRHRPLEAGVVVVDETSMIDLNLMWALLESVAPATRLILVGDADQLPSVGPGRVLGDLIESGRVPAVRLSRVHRQAEASSIVVNAHRIHRGEVPRGDEGDGEFFLISRDNPEEIREQVVELVATRIPQRFGLDPMRDVQLIVPMNRGVLGTRQLNRELQLRLNPSGIALERGDRHFRAGDRVLQLENDYERDVFNGDVGRVLSVDPERGLLSVDFDGRPVVYEKADLDLLAPAYALTVHKAQGSEYRAVVLALHTQHFPLLERSLLYTAVTRGRELVVLVASRRAVELAVRNVRTEARLGRLVERLQSSDPID